MYICIYKEGFEEYEQPSEQIKKTCSTCILTPLAPLVTGLSLIVNHAVIQYDSIWVTKMYLLDLVSDWLNMTHRLTYKQPSYCSLHLSYCNVSFQHLWLWFLHIVVFSICCDIVSVFADCQTQQHRQTSYLSLHLTCCDICCYPLWHWFLHVVTFFLVTIVFMNS